MSSLPLSPLPTSPISKMKTTATLLFVLFLLALPNCSFGDVVTGSIEFGGGHTQTTYGVINWTSDTAGGFSDAGYSESYSLTLSQAANSFESSGTGSLSFNETFHQNAMNSQDLRLSEAGAIRFDTDAGSLLTTSWQGGNVENVLLFVGTGSDERAPNNVLMGGFTVGSGFELMLVGGDDSNFRVGDGSTFNASLGSIGTVFNPDFNEEQTAGVLLVRRTDGGLFNSFGLTTDDDLATRPDNVQLQFALPITTAAVPEPSSCVLIGAGSVLALLRRRRSRNC